MDDEIEIVDNDKILPSYREKKISNNMNTGM